ncbi:flagellar protein FlaG [Paenibacillus frigoriresistens]|uniref:flagellar protein FlaG n=1 Tax=Paenibacillus alginolyticus TaxID=59839 RepID=UPI00156520E4|nr:flagellar protein FlaG [Paenibacillus frigoriresistens]NRF93673.1 flagellar protein FlaG [Paenibacillus frigoriresistens]
MASDFSVGNGASYSSASIGNTPIVSPSHSPKEPDVNVTENIQTTNDLKKIEMEGAPVTFGDQQIIKAIERANKELQGRTTSFEFSIHEKTKQIMVKVLDKDTGEVIREIPPEKTLDMVAKLWEMAGIMVDEKR